MLDSGSLAAPLIGGALIGTSAVLLMSFSGRVAGVSGMVVRSIAATSPLSERLPAAAFVAGLMATPWLSSLWTGRAPDLSRPFDLFSAAAAGMLVGVGVSLANGCTSGHGVCGLARSSPRSAAAVALFMSAAILTVGVRRWTGVL